MRERLLVAVAAISTAGCLLSLSITLPASAGDGARRQANGTLPGVDLTLGAPDGGKRARNAAGDPRPPAPRHGSFRVGNWDVRISGSVSYEIGFGSRPHER